MSRPLSRRNARLVAAGLWTFGAGALVMLAFNLDVAGICMLLMGLASISTARWINAVTANESTASPEQPTPPESPASAT
jgi:hypothetical protein